MTGFKPFNINKLPTFKAKIDDFILTEKLVRRSNLRKSELTEFADRINLSTYGGQRQTQFIANLALNGFSTHSHLIDGRNIDPSVSSMDNSRFVLSMFSNVSETFRRKYVKRYSKLIEPLSQFNSALKYDLLANAQSSVISTSFDFYNKSTFYSMNTNVDALGIIIGDGAGYSYSRFNLLGLSTNFGIWLSYFIDQLSLAGVGFNTPSKIFNSSDLSLLDDYLPQIDDKEVYFDPRLLYVDTILLEDLDSEQERYDHIVNAFIDCLQFSKDFKGSKQSIKDEFGFSLHESIECIEDDLSILLNACKQCREIADVYKVDPSLDILRSGFDVNPVSIDVPLLQRFNITSNLRVMLKCAPTPTTSLEATILDVYASIIELAKETRSTELNSDQVSVREGRFIHTDLTGTDSLTNKLIVAYETETLMQVPMGSYTGVDDFDHDDLSNLIEAEALAAALLNSLFGLLKDCEDHHSNIFSLN